MQIYDFYFISQTIFKKSEGSFLNLKKNKNVSGKTKCEKIRIFA